MCPPGWAAWGRHRATRREEQNVSSSDTLNGPVLPGVLLSLPSFVQKFRTGGGRTLALGQDVLSGFAT